MQIADVILTTPVEGARLVRFRSLTGKDELALFGCDYAAAVAWIAGMVEGGGTTLEGAAVERLTIADGDRLFAALYRTLFGEAVELRQACQTCPESFELSLDLGDILPEASAAERQSITLPHGTAVRTPLLGDLLAAGRGEDLPTRVTVQPGGDTPEAIAAAIAQLAPATVETIETECPHCGARQAILFDLPRFFLRCAERERDLLLRETHLLARTYGWGLAEILSLRRADRHAIVRLATAALAPRDRVQLA